MSEFYQKIAVQNPDILADVEAKAAAAGVELSFECINAIAAAIVSCCVTKSL